jgi:hypothetical protein
MKMILAMRRSPPSALGALSPDEIDPS